MVKRTNGARGVGGWASLMGVSVSPAVLALGGSRGGEGKLNLAFLREDDDPGGKGRNVLGVDGDNHQSGLIGCPSISARVKVPSRENLGRFVVEDCLADIWEEFLFILREEAQLKAVNG